MHLASLRHSKDHGREGTREAVGEKVIGEVRRDQVRAHRKYLM